VWGNGVRFSALIVKRTPPKSVREGRENRKKSTAPGTGFEQRVHEAPANVKSTPFLPYTVKNAVSSGRSCGATGPGEVSTSPGLVAAGPGLVATNRRPEIPRLAIHKYLLSIGAPKPCEAQFLCRFSVNESEF
jgi:hypothetical protein